MTQNSRNLIQTNPETEKVENLTDVEKSNRENSIPGGVEIKENILEEQREDLRRQLKRLQEEQEQILRDTDELQSRLEQPQNQEQMADSRQQLSDARERVRQRLKIQAGGTL